MHARIELCSIDTLYSNGNTNVHVFQLTRVMLTDYPFPNGQRFVFVFISLLYTFDLLTLRACV